MASQPASDSSAIRTMEFNRPRGFRVSPFGVAKCRLRVSCNLFRGFVGALEVLCAMVSARFPPSGEGLTAKGQIVRFFLVSGIL